MLSCEEPGVGSSTHARICQVPHMSRNLTERGTGVLLRRWLLAVVVLGISTSLGGLSVAPQLYNAMMVPRRSAGKVLPMTLPNESRRAVTVQSGRPTVLVLFATWCKYSAYEFQYVIPDLNAYVTSRGGRVIAIDTTDRIGVGTPGPPGHSEAGTDQILRASIPTESAVADALHDFRAKFKPPIVLLYDSRMMMGQKLPLYFEGAYPTFVFVDRNGLPVTRAEGALSLEALTSTFDDVVSQNE